MELSALAMESTTSKLNITAWNDPVVDQLGHDPRSLYAEKFWLGILGPTTMLLLRHCAQSLEDSPQGFDLHFKAAASDLGLGRKTGRASPLARSFERACRFNVVRSLSPNAVQVRRRMQPLNRHQVTRLSPLRQLEHDKFTEGELSMTADQLLVRARRLALGLVECGDTVDSAELQLWRWRFHPSIAADAVRWAYDLHHGPLDRPPLSSN